MYTLLLDSATKVLYVALVKDENVIYEKYLEGKNDHAKAIVCLVDEALKSANIETFNLDRIVVGVGPGSYTGVRMAVSVAKMMAVFAKVKLYSISTLELMASGYTGKVLATIDARRGNAFAAIVDVDNAIYSLEEGLHEYTKLDEEIVDFKVNESNYKVNAIYCINNSKIVDEPHLLVPNYLRDTEAERNLK